MLCVVIDKDLSQIESIPSYADLIELRLDKLQPHAIEPLQVPYILTLKKPEEALRWTHLRPTYFDIPLGTSPALIATLRQRAPHSKIILSYHDFEHIPQDLETLYNAMLTSGADLYKMAVMPHSTNEALRFVLWAKEKRAPLIPIAMGPHGQFSRILGPLSYACLNETAPSAPGQLSADILHTRYRYGQITPQTALYGLIGDPVESSISDVTHNAFFQKQGLDALYLKMQMTVSALPEGLLLLKEMGFRGLSVTMPLKESILPLLEVIDPEARAIGAVNTLVLKNNQWVGFNTDGKGALDALGDVSGQRIALIGAGGTAKAIAYEAHKRGASLTFINRDRAKAERLAQLYGGEVWELGKMSQCPKYDILINSTPSDLPCDPEGIRPRTRVMDVKTRPQWTSFLKEAAQRHCQIIHGEEMFFNQARLQFQIWDLSHAK
jgi:3-dehydroquinate dehydratase/shikimate dehydrogenase